MTRYVIDRIEGNMAVCEAENRNMTVIPLSSLYQGAREGDHIVLKDGTYYRDLQGEKKARRQNISLQNDLFEE